MIRTININTYSCKTNQISRGGRIDVAAVAHLHAREEDDSEGRHGLPPGRGDVVQADNSQGGGRGSGFARSVRGTIV